MINQGDIGSPLLFTPGQCKVGELHSILRTPFSNPGPSSRVSTTKKRVRISCEKEFIPPSKFTRTSRSLSPLGSLSQSLYSTGKKGWRREKFSSCCSCDRISLQALLDPDVEVEWSDRMATPPKRKSVQDNKEDVSPKKGVARALFSKQTMLQDASFIDFNESHSDEQLSPPILTTKYKVLTKTVNKNKNEDNEHETFLQDSSCALLTTFDCSPSVVSEKKNPSVGKHETFNTSGFFSVQTTFTDQSKTLNSSDYLLSPPMLSERSIRSLFDKNTLSQSTPCPNDKSNTADLKCKKTFKSSTHDVSSNISIATLSSFGECDIFTSLSDKTQLKVNQTNDQIKSKDLRKQDLSSDISIKTLSSFGDCDISLSPPVTKGQHDCDINSSPQVTKGQHDCDINSSPQVTKEQHDCDTNLQPTITKGQPDRDINLSPQITKGNHDSPPLSPTIFNETSVVKPDNQCFTNCATESPKKKKIKTNRNLNSHYDFNLDALTQLPDSELDKIETSMTSGLILDLKNANMNFVSKHFHELAKYIKKEDNGDCFSLQNKIVNSSNPDFKDFSDIMPNRVESITETKNQNRKLSFLGFQKSSGKKVEKSEMYLKETKKLFQNVDESNGPEVDKGTAFPGFQTGRGKKVEISEKSLEEAKKLFYNIDEMNEHKLNSKTLFPGFQTGSGKKVEISEKSLKEAKKLLESIDETNEEKVNSKTSFSGFQIGIGKKVEISEKSLKQAKKLFENIDEANKEKSNSKTPFSGFQTGSGKKVEISEKSLKEAKKLFENIDETNKEKLNSKTPFPGFQTGGGKKVVISEKSLKEAKKLFENIDEANKEKSNSKTPFPGFQTGSGKKVEISEKSLKEAKKLFENIDETNEEKLNSKTPFPGFQTGSGKKVEISEKSLKKAKKLFENIDETNEEKLNSKSSFLGFQTGSGKKVEISEKSLKEAKILFENIDDMNEHKVNSKTSLQGFQTGNNKKVEISEKSLKESKTLFGNTDEIKKQKVKSEALFSKFNKGCGSITSSSRCYHETPFIKSRKHRGNIRKVIYTSPNSYQKDRSSSFITPLRPSFSNALKEESEQKNDASVQMTTTATFITPFKSTPNPNTLPVVQASDKKMNMSFCPFRKKSVGSVKSDMSTSNSVYVHEDGRLYKHKLNCKKTFEEFVNYFPPQIYNADELEGYGISKEVLDTTSENASIFQFNASQYFSDTILEQGVANVGDHFNLKFNGNKVISINEFKEAFLSSKSINKILVSDRWIENHYRWIVWKLANYELKYPEQFASCTLTPTAVMLQLKYRYDKEVEHAQRSCLKKIYERDDIASRRIVLCVSSLLSTKDNPSQNIIEMTDGWYPIKASLDPYLKYWLSEGKIKIGTKLMIYGAELIGSEQGCDPLEAPESLMLKLHGNSTRRVSWETKLGYQPIKLGFSIPLSSINPEGGLIGRTDITLLRRYPMQWMEKIEGKYFFRNQNSEDHFQKNYENKKMNLMEKIYFDILKEHGDESVRTRKSSRRKEKQVGDIKNIRNGAEIYDVIQNAADPAYIEASLTASQKEIVSEFHRRQNDVQNEKMKKIFDIEWQKIQDQFPERISMQLQRFRVCDACSSSSSSTILTVWKPTADILEEWNEGVTLSCFNLVSILSRQRNSSCKVQLSTTNQTKYKKKNSTEHAHYIPRKVTSLQKLYNTNFLPFCQEVDVVGFVIRIFPESVSHGSEQTVYLCDITMHIIAIRIPSGIEGNHLGNLLIHSALVGLMNLSPTSGGNPSKNRIPNLLYTDYSCVVSNPKEKHLDNALQQHRKLITDRKDFIKKCENILDDRLVGNGCHSTSNENLSNISMQTPDQMIPTNMLPSEKLHDRQKLQMKKRLSLERFKEPSPLSPLPININSLSVTSKFKMPTPKR